MAAIARSTSGPGESRVVSGIEQPIDLVGAQVSTYALVVGATLRFDRRDRFTWMLRILMRFRIGVLTRQGSSRPCLRVHRTISDRIVARL
jgi:hypothetical protein